MRLTPLILATALTASAQEIPQTEAIQQATQNFIASNIAVCKKHELPEEICKANIQDKINVIIAQINEICKDYPTQLIPCAQFWLEHLMNRDTQMNIITLRSKSV